MNVLIYYFTGTGNSLLVAKKIAERIEGAVIRPLMELYGTYTDKTTINLSDVNAIGFVVPVYYGRIPAIVRKIIEKAKFSETQYFFAAVTSGGEAGDALFEFDSILRFRGARLDYGKAVDMSDNSILIRTSEGKATKRLAQIDDTADEIARAITHGIKMEHFLKRKSIFSIEGSVSKFVLRHYYKIESRAVNKTRCSQCGLCTKICPVGNISMNGQGVVIGDNCEWCFGCLNWCPKSAIVFGRIDPLKKQQYRCPGISAADIERK